MTDGGRGVAWIQVFGVIAAALIAAAVAFWTHTSVPSAPGPQQTSTLDNRPRLTQPQNGNGLAVMGQLEVGINRQGMDFSANGVVTANAEICADLCRTNSDCKAMTYVVSLKTCWLKAGVPPPLPPGGPDYISAVKN